MSTVPPVPYAHEGCRVVGCECGNLAREKAAEAAPVPSDTDRLGYSLDEIRTYLAGHAGERNREDFDRLAWLLGLHDTVRDQLHRVADENQRLQERLTTAAALHKPERRYTPNLAESYSFDTPEEAAEYDDIEIELVAHFDVCAHCGDIESDDDPDRDFRESLWPCATARALGLGEEAER